MHTVSCQRWQEVLVFGCIENNALNCLFLFWKRVQDFQKRKRHCIWCNKKQELSGVLISASAANWNLKRIDCSTSSSTERTQPLYPSLNWSSWRSTSTLCVQVFNLEKFYVRFKWFNRSGMQLLKTPYYALQVRLIRTLPLNSSGLPNCMIEIRENRGPSWTARDKKHLDSPSSSPLIVFFEPWDDVWEHWEANLLLRHTMQCTLRRPQATQLCTIVGPQDNIAGWD